MGLVPVLWVTFTLVFSATGQIQFEDLSIVGIRLVDGPNAHSGRVEIGVQETADNTSAPVWGTVCDDEWDDMDAIVICKMLNYSYGGMARGGAYFGPGSGPIWLDDAVCDGRETHIRQCRGTITHDCDHEEDAGVECYISPTGSDVPFQPPKGNPRIIVPFGSCGGNVGPVPTPKVSLLSYGHPDIRSAGVVQVTLEGRPGSVCDDYFDITMARVFCKLMCFDRLDEVTIGAPEDIIGRPVLPYIPFQLQCRGDEVGMEQCIRGPANPFECGSSEAAAVTCTNLTSYFDIISDSHCMQDVDYRGTTWHSTRVNVTAVSPCPIAYKGLAFRKCSSNSTWEDPHYNQCVKLKIQRVVDRISALNQPDDDPSPDAVLSVIWELANVTDVQETNLTSGDIKVVVGSFPDVVSLDRRSRAGINLTEAFVTTVSNVMTESTRREWISIQEEKDSRVLVKLLDAVTDSGFLAAGKVVLDSEPAVVTRENLVFEAGTVTARDITFPQTQPRSGDSELDCRNAVSTNLRKATLENIPHTEGVHPYTAALYTSLGYLQSYQKRGENISSVLPSVAVHVATKDEILLDPPLEVTFRSCVTKRQRLTTSPNHRTKRNVQEESEIVRVRPPLNCIRKEEKGNWIVWTTADCEMMKSTEEFTECRCKKSGQTAGNALQKFLEFLKKFLAKYACLFPIFAVIFKISKMIYTECNKPRGTGSALVETKLGKLKAKCSLISDQPIRKLMIGLILCFIIIISNAELIAAVENTENRESCMAIAGTLHFFFLVECFYFMAQAVDILLPDTLWIPWFLLLVGLPWVASVFLVAVAVGSFTREAYLGENLCWLSKDSGSYLFLVIPAAFVPVVQLIALVKKSREQPCGCKNDENSSKWKRLKTWVTEHKHLLEFGLGITLMSSQVLISLFADDDKGVKDVFFGLFTFAKGLILAVTGISEDEDKNKPEENKKSQELDSISSDSQEAIKKVAKAETPDQERRNKNRVTEAFENPMYTISKQKDDVIDGEDRKGSKEIKQDNEAVYENTDGVSQTDGDNHESGDSLHPSDGTISHQKSGKDREDLSQHYSNVEDDVDDEGACENNEDKGSGDDDKNGEIDETEAKEQSAEPVYQNMDMSNENEDEVQNQSDRNSDLTGDNLHGEEKQEEIVDDKAIKFNQHSDDNYDDKHQREIRETKGVKDSSQKEKFPGNHQGVDTDQRGDADHQPRGHYHGNALGQEQCGESNIQHNDRSNYYEPFSTPRSDSQHHYEEFRPRGNQIWTNPEVDSEA